MFPGMLRCTVGAVGDCLCGQGSLFGAVSGVQWVRVECSLGGGTAGGKTSRQEYWSGLSFSSPGDLSTSGSNLGFPHCRQILFGLNYHGSTTGIQ